MVSDDGGGRRKPNPARVTGARVGRKTETDNLSHGRGATRRRFPTIVGASFRFP